MLKKRMGISIKIVFAFSRTGRGKAIKINL